MLNKYVIYLRKSRKDVEAEQRGEGETLARHEKALLELAKMQRLNVTDIYREIVSGDTIAARPIMQKLLTEVEAGLWAGVLVMEVERLARGDTIDQGIVAQTFKFSSTVIVTPGKTFDPQNEFDEEYFEFNLYMSRREYKTINRRLQRGRMASIKEGKWVANKAPYGYERYKLEGQKGFSLKIIPEEADVVRLIFDLSIKGNGSQNIAYKLNDLGLVSSSGGHWTKETIRDMLSNPTYCGFVRWDWRPENKKMVNGKIVKERPRNKEVTLVKALHEGIISKETYDLTQERYKGRVNVADLSLVKNPFAGLIYCSKCGRLMTRRPYYNPDKNKDMLMCITPHCSTVASYISIIEDRVLAFLEEWLKGYKVEIKQSSQPPSVKVETLSNALESAKAERDAIKEQQNTAYTMLERKVYDTDTFLERSRVIAEQLEDIQAKIKKLNAALGVEKSKELNISQIIPRVETVLSVYKSTESMGARNEMLKSVIAKIEYSKDKRGTSTGANLDKFILDIYPKIPKK